MVNLYNPIVSDTELAAAPIPTDNDVTILSQALGIALKVGVSLPAAVEIIAEITPNAHLRHYLGQAKEAAQQDQGISDTFTNSQYIFAMPVFLSALVLGEGIDRLSETCLLFAEGKGIRQYALADQVGCDETTIVFSAHMALQLNQGNAVLHALRTAPDRLPFKAAIIDNVERGCFLWEALRHHSKIFGPLYIEMIRTLEADRQNQKAKLAEAFTLLTNS